MKYKVIASAVVVLGLIVYLSIFIFNKVQEDEWKVQRSAVQTAYEKTILTEADKVETFVGDQPFTVVHGMDKIGQRLIVWVGQDQIYTQMETDGITADQAGQLLMARQPAAEIMRLIPGVLNGALVWEAFYKVMPEDAGRGHFYYDYYNFKDGAYIDTYNLNIN
ncbi:DUF5590 domain-containing protein [Paenibacillus piri]|uniref:cell wall elongation regulator TseB-like domain-containing protein n=1 Tax=Paenibacillus piri TaxID=2547395 RepID=UPI001FEC5F1F|nr:DUF5590 domain-containing protein [Paenibacillus piri]